MDIRDDTRRGRAPRGRHRENRLPRERMIHEERPHRGVEMPPPERGADKDRVVPREIRDLRLDFTAAPLPDFFTCPVCHIAVAGSVGNLRFNPENRGAGFGVDPLREVRGVPGAGEEDDERLRFRLWGGEERGRGGGDRRG